MRNLKWLNSGRRKEEADAGPGARGGEAASCKETVSVPQAGALEHAVFFKMSPMHIALKVQFSRL